MVVGAVADCVDCLDVYCTFDEKVGWSLTGLEVTEELLG
jgi:hypothetical protein